jgi:hypothetical protein
MNLKQSIHVEVLNVEWGDGDCMSRVELECRSKFVDMLNEL